MHFNLLWDSSGIVFFNFYGCDWGTWARLQPPVRSDIHPQCSFLPPGGSMTFAVDQQRLSLSLAFFTRFKSVQFNHAIYFLYKNIKNRLNAYKNHKKISTHWSQKWLQRSSGGGEGQILTLALTFCWFIFDKFGSRPKNNSIALVGTICFLVILQKNK